MNQLPRFQLQDNILEQLRKNGRASAHDLVPLSESTLGSVRECLKRLCRAGLVKKSPVSFEAVEAKKSKAKKS